MESSDFQQSNDIFLKNPETYDYAQKFQTYKLYSILCILLKSEAIFTFFVYWIRGLERTSGTINIPDHNTLSHIWLLKPFFSLIIDKLNIPISQNQDNLEKPTLIPKIVQYRPSVTCSLLGVSNYRVIVLLLAEFTLAICSVIIYVLYHIDYFHTIFTKIFIYIFALSLVCASSYCEGLFYRYSRSKGENSYVKLVSLRLMLSSTYGLTTILFLILPAILPQGRLSNFLQINFLFPVFLVLNSLFVAFLASKHFLPPQLQNYQDRWSPPSSSDQLLTDSGFVTNDVSVKLLCLVSLLIISMRMKNDFFNKYNDTVSKKYLFVLSIQFFKIVVSLFIYLFLNTRAVMSVSLWIFGLTILLMIIPHGHFNFLYKFISQLGHMEVPVVGFFFSFVHQFLITYGILLALLIAVRGYEACTLSLPTFGAHLTYLSLKHGIIDYLDLSTFQSFILETLSFTFFFFCFKVLLNIKKSTFNDKYNADSINSENMDEKSDSKLLDKSLYYSMLQAEVRSPWEQHSDGSYDSDVL